MAKKIEGYLKLQVPAGQASPSPPIGPALGQRGLNIMDFCKAFNAKTQNEEQGTPLPTTITIYVDKSFDFVIKTAPTSYLLKKAAKIDKGAANVGHEINPNKHEIKKNLNSELHSSGAKAARHINKGIGGTVLIASVNI